MTGANRTVWRSLRRRVEAQSWAMVYAHIDSAILRMEDRIYEPVWFSTCARAIDRIQEWP